METLKNLLKLKFERKSLKTNNSLADNPCEDDDFTLYDVADETNPSIHEAKIPDQWSFYWIFDTLQKVKPEFSTGRAEVLIGLTYRRGDGFRWMDGSAPNDLSFLKFNPIDNLDDEDNLVGNYCLRFSIVVDENANDGFGTKWYECDEKDSINYTKKSFYLLCSYHKVIFGFPIIAYYYNIRNSSPLDSIMLHRAN
uniref:MATH domain-containing protein n=1 Tax=Elaeophora elaphi TaxID=1147741 RepID=A0A0R3RNI8_9BILA